MARHDAVGVDEPVLFGLDVHGVQKYLFATSKLREIVGASQLAEDFTSDLPKKWMATCDSCVPVRLGGGCVRVILASAARARELAAFLGEWAATHAPTLDFDHADVPFDCTTGDLGAALGSLVEKINAVRTARTSGGAFAGFPFTAPCRLTADAATGYGKDANERLCAASLSKRFAQNDAVGEWAKCVEGHEILRFVADTRRPFEFETDQIAGGDGGHSYVAVICVDLNGLGERGRAQTAGKHGKVAAEAFHAFTITVEKAIQTAFRAALSTVATDDASHRILDSHKNLPIRPLVMGGDDLTFVVHGSLAVPFTLGLLKSFDSSGFKSGAGIAFIKCKSPFGRAVELAESLVASAKSGGRDQTRLDFMLCPGEIPSSAREGRAQRTFEDRVLFSGPWTIGEFDALLSATRDLHQLPRSHIRGAADRCRVSVESGDSAFADLFENLKRGIGGRGKKPMTPDTLTHHFGKDSFFHGQRNVGGVNKHTTRLLDCIDLFRFVVTETEEQECENANAAAGGAR